MKTPLSTNRTIIEATRETEVFAETDVLVIGGGPGGITAAIAAAREGANTLLVERYGHLGGMATGGLVLMINQYPSGQCQEWLDKLESLGGVRDLTITNEPGPLKNSIMVNPELLKCILNNMADEAGVNQLLHTWGTQAIVDENCVQGVITESKSGRQALLGKVTIDATGDGDIFASAGAKYDGAIDHGLRNSQLALVFRIGNINYDQFVDFRTSNPQKWQEIRGEIDGIAGFHIGPVPGSRNEVVWINSFIKGLNPLKIEDLTWVEINVRKAMLPIYDFFKKRVPGFENSFIYDSASQIGTRGSRRLVGEHILTRKDAQANTIFDDTIAVFPKGVPLTIAQEKTPENVGLPYRCLLPVDVDGLLVAGRCFSSDPVANTMFNVIPHCVAMGQAAGTAAALSVKDGVIPRKIIYQTLQKRLIAQGVSLPDNLIVN